MPEPSQVVVPPGPGRARRVLAVVAAGAALLVAAAFAGFIGIIGAFWQPGVVAIGGVLLPVGLAGALLLTYVAARVLSELTPGRAGAVAAAVGWTATVLLLTSSRTAGDIVVPGTWYGYTFLAVGLAIVLWRVMEGTFRRASSAGAAPRR